MSDEKTIVIGASSTIGHALAKDWLESGRDVVGTYRKENSLIQNLRHAGGTLIPCDTTCDISVHKFLNHFSGITWNVLTYMPAEMEPIGSFTEIDIDKWEYALKTNLLAPLRLLKLLLPFASENASVLFWAGSGTNSAPVNTSAYTVSKIALMKMCELLDAESPTCRFSIIGPGWVKAPIHQSIIEAGPNRAGENHQTTINRLGSDDFTSLQDIVDCANWILSQPKTAIGGRNISVVHDGWRDPQLSEQLIKDSEMFKLRRSRNGFTNNS